MKKKKQVIKEKSLFEFSERKKKEFKPQKLFQKSKYKLSCGAIIYNLDKNVPYYLLLKYPTYWGFVKGEVEPGETEEKTINREAAEEAGLYDLQIIPGFRETQHYFYRFQGQLIRKDAVYFIAKTNSWKIKISYEHENYKWCTYEEAMELMKLRANRELLTKAHIFLQEYYKQKKLF
ncbi:MAG: NUDIX domain-containing protein [Candidatus Pacearchaeota archaeon]